MRFYVCNVVLFFCLVTHPLLAEVADICKSYKSQQNCDDCKTGNAVLNRCVVSDFADNLNDLNSTASREKFVQLLRNQVKFLAEKSKFETGFLMACLDRKTNANNVAWFKNRSAPWNDEQGLESYCQNSLNSIKSSLQSNWPNFRLAQTLGFSMRDVARLGKSRTRERELFRDVSSLPFSQTTGSARLTSDEMQRGLKEVSQRVFELTGVHDFNFPLINDVRDGREDKALQLVNHTLKKEYQQKYFALLKQVPMLAFVKTDHPSDSELRVALQKFYDNADQTSGKHFSVDELLNFEPQLKQILVNNPQLCSVAQKLLSEKAVRERQSAVKLGIAAGLSATGCLISAFTGIAIPFCFVAGGLLTVDGLFHSQIALSSETTRAFSTLDTSFIESFDRLNEAERSRGIELMLAPTAGFGAGRALGLTKTGQATREFIDTYRLISRQSGASGQINREFTNIEIVKNLKLSDPDRLARISDLAVSEGIEMEQAQKLAKAIFDDVHNIPGVGRIGYRTAKEKFERAVELGRQYGARQPEVFAASCIRSGLCGLIGSSELGAPRLILANTDNIELAVAQLNKQTAKVGGYQKTFMQYLNRFRSVQNTPALVGIEMEGVIPSQLSYSQIAQSIKDQVVKAYNLPPHTVTISGTDVTYMRNGKVHIWRVENDQSIVAPVGMNGVEVVTPVLRDSQDFDLLRKVTSELRRLGVREDPTAGLHAHVGLQDQGARARMTLQDQKELDNQTAAIFDIYSVLEDQVRSFFKPYATRDRFIQELSPQIRARLRSGQATQQELVEMTKGKSEKYSIRATSFDTIEGRLGNSSFDPETVVEYAQFWTKFIGAVREQNPQFIEYLKQTPAQNWDLTTVFRHIKFTPQQQNNARPRLILSGE